MLSDIARQIYSPSREGSSRPSVNQRAVALHFMHYNFCRVHQTLRITPAMEAGIRDQGWSIEELVRLLDTTKVQHAA